MLYLFCSAAIPLYKRDALEVLCYPSKHIFRFRYDRIYVQTEIWNTPSSFEATPGILVFVDTVGEAGRMDFNFYPIRRITILRSHIAGTAIYIGFRLGDFFNYGPDDKRRAAWDRFFKALPARPWPPPERSGRPPHQQGWFALSAAEIPDDLTTESAVPYENWQSVVQRLDTTEDLAGSTFYLILGYYRIARRLVLGPGKRISLKSKEVLLKSTDNDYDSIYPVPMGKNVVLKVLLSRPTFQFGDPASRRVLKITPSGEAFAALSKDVIHSESRYNEDRTIVVCKRVFDSALSILTISELNEPAQIRSARPTLLTRIKVPRWVVVAVVMGVGFSTLLLALDAETITFLSRLFKEPWGSWIGCNSKTLATIAKGLSPFPVATSALLVFKRLPIK